MLFSFDTLASAFLLLTACRYARRAVLWDLDRAERLREERESLHDGL